MKKIEWILWSGFLVLVLLTIFRVLHFSAIAIYAILFSLMYALSGLVLLNGISPVSILDNDAYTGISLRRIFGSIAAGFIYALVVISVLFKALSWPGAKINVLFSLSLLLIITIVAYFKYRRWHNAFYKEVLIRNILFIALLVALLFIPVSR